MCRKFIVSGRVQGVFFRATTRDRAESLRLAGSAVNLPDGTVEVIACGDAAAIGALHTWLAEGPENARVSEVQEIGVDCLQPAAFTTG